MTEVATKEIRLKRVGECIRCGNCCRVGIMRLHKSAVAGGDEDVLRDLFAWYSCREGVEIVEDDVSFEIQVHRPCQFLAFDEDAKAQCMNYENRFMICRAFPNFPTKQCLGFRFVPVDEDGV